MNTARGQGMEGIYQLEGDRLTICMGPPGNPRPTEFASKADNPRLLLVVLKHESPASRQDTAANLLLNPGFEESVDAQGRKPLAWIAETKTTQTEPEAKCFRDTAVMSKGKASGAVVKAELENPLAEAGFTQIVERLPAGETLYLRGQIKTKDVVGSAFLKLLLRDSQGRFLGVQSTPPVSGTTEWKLYSTSIKVPADAKAAVALVIRGKGSVWFDEVYCGTAEDAPKAVPASDKGS
jgi:hypothetical protein